MVDPLALAVAQPVSVLGDVAGNAHRHAVAVSEARARVVVFPELSLTGYALDAEPVAADDDRLGPIVTACERTGAVALVGAPSSPQRGRDRPSIAVLAIDGLGARVAYRKMWLGGEEASTFAPGDRPAVVDVDGWRLGLAVCKDTGVADHATATAALGVDAYLAGVCETEADRAVPAERAARIIADHGIWVAIASFAGPTGGGFDATAGRSAIWRPDGSVVVAADHRPGRVVRAVVEQRV